MIIHNCINLSTKKKHNCIKYMRQENQYMKYIYKTKMVHLSRKHHDLVI